jgi:hypothetical protein
MPARPSADERLGVRFFRRSLGRSWVISRENPQDRNSTFCLCQRSDNTSLLSPHVSEEKKMVKIAIGGGSGSKLLPNAMNDVMGGLNLCQLDY